MALLADAGSALLQWCMTSPHSCSLLANRLAPSCARSIHRGSFSTTARSCSCVHCSSPHAHCTCLVQADIWKWFLEPSLFGTDVLTLGGSRGPSVSYYVPYLSAMQLLLPAVPRATTPVRPSRALAGSEAAAPAGGAHRGLREASRPAQGKVYQLAQEWRGWPAQVSSVACPAEMQ